jgi:hypothetical protein
VALQLAQHGTASGVEHADGAIFAAGDEEAAIGTEAAAVGLVFKAAQRAGDYAGGGIIEKYLQRFCRVWKKTETRSQLLFCQGLCDAAPSQRAMLTRVPVVIARCCGWVWQ